MRRYLSKKEKEEAEFCAKVAEKFGIKPISIRATRLLYHHCESADQVREWIRSRHILKIRQMGKKTLRELFCAFGFCQSEEVPWHHDCCPSALRCETNYRAELANYAQIFRKRISISKLI